MGNKKAGYVRNERGEREEGQQMRPQWLEPVEARAFSDVRLRDYEAEYVRNHQSFEDAMRIPILSRAVLQQRFLEERRRGLADG